MEHKLSLFFHIRKHPKNKDLPALVYLRITVNGKRFEQSINCSTAVDKWSVSTGRMKGNSPEAKALNNYIDALTSKVHAAERELTLDGIEITYENFKDKWFGVPEKKQLILEVFHRHNEEVAKLVGKDFAPATLQRYRTSLDHTRNFIQWKYKAADIDVTRLDYEFISSFALWLKTVRNCNHNSTMKYLANFKKIILICLKQGWISKDPFLAFKITKHEVERPVLTEAELELVSSKIFSAERLNLVKDIFIFSCYTGLAYADVKKLKRQEVIGGTDTRQWIATRRQKTDTPSRIPLLPVASALLDKYKDHPQCSIKGQVLPILSNQKMNAYLKEIADICGIDKNLTFHIARHTFATTVTLSNGVPIETVSKMLGHTNLKTTQHYAKILDLKVTEDMETLKTKLTAKQKSSQVTSHSITEMGLT